MFNKILLCSDASETALNAAKTCAELAKKLESEVIVLNVYTPVPVFAPNVTTVDAGLLVDALTPNIEDVQKHVELRTGQVLDEFGVAYRSVREVGNVADAIVKAADAEKVDLIVLGSHEMGGFERLLMGSVSDGVLHHAHCPVLVVRS